MNAPVVAVHGWATKHARLTYHLAWVLADMEVGVVVADLDPFCTPSLLLVGPDAYDACIEARRTAADLLEAHLSGRDPGSGWAVAVADRLAVVPGTTRLGQISDRGDETWRARGPKLRELLCAEARRVGADIVLLHGSWHVDAPALAAATHLVVPVHQDRWAIADVDALGGRLRVFGARPIGYVLLPPGPLALHERDRLDLRSAGLLRRRIHASLFEAEAPGADAPDPFFLGRVRLWPTLDDLAERAEKPVFHLSSADGADGTLLRASADARREYEALATAILERVR